MYDYWPMWLYECGYLVMWLYECMANVVMWVYVVTQQVFTHFFLLCGYMTDNVLTETICDYVTIKM